MTLPLMVMWTTGALLSAAAGFWFADQRGTSGPNGPMQSVGARGPLAEPRAVEQVTPVRQTRKATKTGSPSQPLAPCDPESPVENAIRAASLVTRPSGQALLVDVTSRLTTGEQFFVMRSVAVYDEHGKEVTAPVRSRKAALSPRATQDSQQIELPEGLPDGYYYAELLTAFTKDESAAPVIDGQRLYFRTMDGQFEVLDPEDWAKHANALPAALDESE